MTSTKRIFIMVTVISVATLYLGLCCLLYVSQRSLIYYPQPRLNTDSMLMTLPVGAAQVHVSTHPQAGNRAVIYFGGNTEDVSQDVPNLANVFPDAAIYTLHYPGYGGSSGSPSEQAIFTDALALFDKVAAQHPDIILIGRSLGSGVAVWVASQRPTECLVLVTPFDSFADPASAQYRIFPVRWLLRDKFESWRYAPTVTAPTHIIVAGDDELVPRSSSDRLRTRFRHDLVSYTVIPGYGHNTIQEDPGYWALLSQK